MCNELTFSVFLFEVKMLIEYLKCKRPCTCETCGVQFSKTAKIDGVRRNLSGRRECLKCSPYKDPIKYKTIDGVDYKWCNFERALQPLKNFTISPSGHRQTYCRDCTKKDWLIRYNSAKRKSIEYTGDKCRDCGNIFPDYMYDFHHLDPTQKDFKIAGALTAKWEKLQKELDKCVLLCPNCHRERHHQFSQHNTAS